jgi:hypothetical protein
MWGSPGKWDAGKRAPSQLPSLTKTSRLRPEWSKSLNSRREIEIKAGLVASRGDARYLELKHDCHEEKVNSLRPVWGVVGERGR